MNEKPTTAYRHAGIPLGGPGTGTFDLRSDGFTWDWTIFNNRPLGAGPPTAVMNRHGLFFGLAAEAPSGRRHLRLLAEAPGFDYQLCNPYELPWLRPCAGIEMDGHYPVARLRYDLAGPPIDVELTACSPFTPLDPDASGRPAALLRFRIRNRSRRPWAITFAATLRNGCGYDREPFTSRMEIERVRGGRVVEMTAPGLPADAASNGALALGMSADGRPRYSYSLNWANARHLWEPLYETGDLLDEVLPGNPCPFVRWGSIAARVTVPAGGETEVRVTVGWVFPNFHERPYPEKGKTPRRIGHRYSERWTCARDVAADTLQRFDAVARPALEFVETMTDTDLPRPLVESALAQLSTLAVSSWWDRDGAFAIWEGLGCCGLQTMDITHYGSFPIALMFPELQKSQMRLSLRNLEPEGRIPHLMPGSFQCSDLDNRKRIDLMPQFVLLVFRDVLWTGDLDYAREMYPAVRGALDFVLRHDTDGDGLPNNTGTDQTYDTWPMIGTTAYVGGLHLASLHAAARLADWLGEPGDAARWRADLNRARAACEQQLWTGRYYRVAWDNATGIADEGCMSDQVNGEWFLALCDGARVLDPRRVRSALREIVRRNRMPDAFLANCTWPDPAARPPKTLDLVDQAATPWTGIEYTVASHLILEGMADDGVRLAADVFDRHDTLGLRTNHIECGQHYYRAMSAWALILAATGFRWDAIEQALSFRSAVGDALRAPFHVPTGYGTVEIVRGRRLRLRLRHGRLRLRQLALRDPGGAVRSVAHNGDRLPPDRWRAGDDSAGVRFRHPMLLRTGDELLLHIGPDAA